MQVHLLSLIHFRTAHLFPSSWSFYQCNIMQLLPRGHSVSCVKLLSTFFFWNSKYSVTASKQQTNQEDRNDKNVCAKCMMLKGDFWVWKKKKRNTPTLSVWRVWELTALIRESSTLTAKAVPQAKGWVRYSSVSGSSSSSWSRNWTFESFTARGGERELEAGAVKKYEQRKPHTHTDTNTPESLEM